MLYCFFMLFVITQQITVEFFGVPASINTMVRPQRFFNHTQLFRASMMNHHNMLGLANAQRVGGCLSLPHPHPSSPAGFVVSGGTD
jgi:hypothetical protein